MRFKRPMILQATVLWASLSACSNREPMMALASNSGGEVALGYDANERTPDLVARARVDTAPSSDGLVGAGAKGYIALLGDGAVAVLDLARKRVVKTISVGTPHGLVITPDGKQLFVSSGDSGSVKVLSTDTDTVRDSIDVGPEPAGLALTPDGRLLIAAVGGANQALIIDAASHAILRRVPAELAHASCVTSDGRFAFVASQSIRAPAVVKINLRQDVPPQVFPVDKPPRALACEADRILFRAVGAAAIEQVDPASGAQGTPIAPGRSSHDLGTGRPRRLEIAVSQTVGDLGFLDTEGAAVVAKLPTGTLPHWITLAGEDDAAWGPSGGDENVVLLNLVARTITEMIVVSKAPRKLALRL